METLLSIAIALCAGLLVSRFVKPLKLPAVTGYLIAGILIGPYCLGKLGVQGLGFPTTTDVKALSLFNDVALGFIAFAIGNEFRLSQLRQTGKQATVIGIFQALMPTLGYFLGTTFSNLIDQFDHWVAFILLAIIGVNMVREALSKDKDDDEANDDFGFKTMLLLAIATSIDALAVGVTFALEGTDIALAAGLIGLTTFTLSPIGLLVGNRFGLRYKSKAELVGGLVLIGIGLKILLEGLGLFG